VAYTQSIGLRNDDKTWLGESTDIDIAISFFMMAFEAPIIQSNP
jgi:hypothetical protein